MNGSSWIAIYMPLIIIFLIVLPRQRQIQMSIRQRIRRKKGVFRMTNEMIRKYIGRYCTLSTGMSTSVRGRILDVNENWVEVETKKGIEVMNAEFLVTIRVEADPR